MSRLLYILLIDDDEPSGCVDAVKIVLNSCLRPGNYKLDTPRTYEKGDLYLGNGKTYDLVLIDLRLDGEHRWGGRDLLDKHWRQIESAGSKVILYSGKEDAKLAFEGFSSGRGPFLFHPKINEKDVGEEFERQIIRLLRERVRMICQRASLQSAFAAANEKATWVRIGEDDWSVDSLLAPWLFTLPGEAERGRASVLRTLFPSDDMIRVFSYWFKGRGFGWPADSMYGLSPLAPYHFDRPTGPLDALTHNPTSRDISPKFSTASRIASDDLELLQLGVSPNACEALRDYVGEVWQWERIDSPDRREKAERLKGLVTFRIKEIEDIFVGRGARVSSSATDGLRDFEFYCPPDPGASMPAVLYALSRFADSAAKRARAAWEVEFSWAGQPYASRRPAELPYLLITTAHAGPPCEPGRKIGEAWFPDNHAGYGLADAKEALKSCAQWVVLSGRGGLLETYDAPTDPGTVTADEAQSLWERFNGGGKWNVIHVMKLAFPCVKGM
ncbi:MAG TPA: response regulator [Blastocatellia bacterium]|nr:response regulator [Blastocatellia bacterium]